MGAKIDRELFKMKAHYFLSHSAVAPIVPYIATYARQLGFSSMAVGFTAANLTLFAFILKPLFGYIGDRFHMRKTLVLILLVVVATTLMATNFIQPLEPIVSFDRRCAAADSEVLEYCPQIEMRRGCLLQQVLTQRSNINQRMECRLTCFHRDNDSTNSTDGYYVHLEIDLTRVEEVGECLHFSVANALASICNNTNATTLPWRCSGTCSDPNVMTVLANNRVDTDRHDSLSAQLWFFVVCITMASVGIVGTATVSNAMCFAVLGARTHLFGHQRVWGSLGWGVFALLSGFVVDAMSDGKVMKNYSGLFYTMLVVITFDWLAVLWMKDVHTETSTTIMTDIGRLVLKPRVIVFCMWCIVVGMGTSVIGNFLFWHLEEMAESDNTTCEGTSAYIKTIQGLAIGVQTFLGEVPMWVASGWLLKRIGYTNAMSLALAGFGVECVLYAWLTNIWWVLPIEVLQGAVAGLFGCSMVSYANEISPVGAEATLQGLASAVYGGIGRTIGGIVAGYGVQKIGVRTMFTVYGYGSFVLCVVHVVVHLVLNRFWPAEKHADAIAEVTEVTEDMLSAHAAEQSDEINLKHKYTSKDKV